MPVVVVTDSSSCLPLSVAGHYAIRTVPLHLSADGVDYRDGVDEVPENLVTTPGVNTSGANPHELGEAFEEAVAASYAGLAVDLLSTMLGERHLLTAAAQILHSRLRLARGDFAGA